MWGRISPGRESRRGKREPEVSRHSVTGGARTHPAKIHIAAATMTDGEFCSDSHEGRSRLSYRIEVGRCQFFEAVSVFVFFKVGSVFGFGFIKNRGFIFFKR